MAKTCLKCGEIIEDNKIEYCPQCGTKLGQPQKYESGMITAAYVIMIITTVALGWLLIPLAWMIPFTVKIKRRMDGGAKLSTAFKICCLIFGNLISGILLLCDSDS